MLSAERVTATYKSRRGVDLILLVDSPVVLPAPPVIRSVLTAGRAAGDDGLPGLEVPDLGWDRLREGAGGQGEAAEDGPEEAGRMHGRLLQGFLQHTCVDGERGK